MRLILLSPKKLKRRKHFFVGPRMTQITKLSKISNLWFYLIKDKITIYNEVMQCLIYNISLKTLI